MGTGVLQYLGHSEEELLVELWSAQAGLVSYRGSRERALGRWTWEFLVTLPRV